MRESLVGVALWIPNKYTEAIGLMSVTTQRVGDATPLVGQRVSRRLLEECRAAAEDLSAHFGVIPRLAVILVGDDPASAIYVRAKERACAEAGVSSTVIRLSSDSSTQTILDAIDGLACDDNTHGIIVQLPIAPGIDLQQVLERIPTEKDVDGFHPHNVGSLALGDSDFPPCTPEGVMRLLDDADVELSGANVVIVGASNIVGKPMALMALQRQATVTICHSKTRDLAVHTRLADILICAAGHPRLITPDMVKHGAVVIDVGINRLDDGTVTGDVDFDGVAPKASYITPVPGGVGPMTVAMLITNTVRAAQRFVNTRRCSAERHALAGRPHHETW